MDDLISRQAAIGALWKALYKYEDETEKQFQASDELDVADWIVHRTFVQNMSDIDRQTILDLPSAQPEIIYCKDCVKHNKGHGYYLDGTVIGIKDCCPLVEIRGMAKGHEFDYQYCAYAERRTDE